MADATIRQTEQVRFSCTPRDGEGQPQNIDGRVQLVAVDPADPNVEVPLPDGWSVGPDQANPFEAVLLPPTSISAPIVGPTVKLKADADMTAAQVFIASRTWQIDGVNMAATVLDAALVVEPRGT